MEGLVISKAEKWKVPQVEWSVFEEQYGCNIKLTDERTKMRMNDKDTARRHPPGVWQTGSEELWKEDLSRRVKVPRIHLHNGLQRDNQKRRKVRWLLESSKQEGDVRFRK